jgi:uncharacterized membrane protein
VFIVSENKSFVCLGCKTMLSSKYSYCEVCHKDDVKQMVLGLTIFVFVFAVFVGLVSQFHLIIRRFFTFGAQYFINFYEHSSLFLQGFILTILVFICISLFSLLVYLSVERKRF